MSILGRSAETKQLAETAFFAILGEGKMPTVDLVNAWIENAGGGRRNRNVISEQIKEGYVALGRRISGELVVPGLTPETVKMVMTLRDHLMEVCKKQFKDELDAMRVAVEGAQAAATAQVSDTNAKLEQERLAHRELLDRYQAQSSELTQANEARHVLQASLSQANALLAARQERLAAMEAEREGHATRQIALERTHGEALQRESERYRQLQESLMQQVDGERQRATRLAKQLELSDQRLRDQAAQTALLERKFNDERASISAEVGQARGRAEALQEQLDRMQQDLSRQINETAELRNRYEQQQLELVVANKRTAGPRRKS